ncbi:MAG: transposase [Solirubrobacteraceae bacterium]|jgi:hypothetical protein
MRIETSAWAGRIAGVKAAISPAQEVHLEGDGKYDVWNGRCAGGRHRLVLACGDGGRCVSDLAALAGQPALFGNVASVSTARRVLSIGQAEIDRIRWARALARGRAWQAGAAPDRVILDFDATPISVHSEKEHAAGHYKGGFGFNPLLVSCDREVLAGVLRPGNAGANNAEDHMRVLELALEQGRPRATAHVNVQGD